MLWKADVCHAYQILKRGGLKDKNIIVFMYDDIAYDSENPYPGKIINKPDGPDVYEGVPKVRILLRNHLVLVWILWYVFSLVRREHLDFCNYVRHVSLPTVENGVEDFLEFI